MPGTDPTDGGPQDVGDDLIRRDENYEPDEVAPVPDEPDEVDEDDGEDEGE